MLAYIPMYEHPAVEWLVVTKLHLLTLLICHTDALLMQEPGVDRSQACIRSLNP